MAVIQAEVNDLKREILPSAVAYYPVSGRWRAVSRWAFSKQRPLPEIPRVVNPSSAVFNRYFVDLGAPVIIVGSEIFRSGPTTFDDLVAGAGDMEVVVRGGDYSTHSGREQRRIRLVEYLDSYIRGSVAEGAGASGKRLPPYAAHNHLSKKRMDSLGLVYPLGCNPRTTNRPNMWLGPANSLTPLHYDSNDNLICQYVGRKQLTLYPPSQIKWLYTYGYGPSWSRVDNPLTVDLNTYPRFANAQHVDVMLAPGEILYLPARWSHFVVNPEASLMVNFWPRQTLTQKMRMTLDRRLRQVKRLCGFPG